MAYVIKYDDDYLFDPYVGEDTVTDATITATINASSYFDFTITRDHRLYNTVKERSGIVSVYFESTLLFMGEITSIEEDFYGSKTISCVDPRDQLSNVLLRPYSTVEGEQANLAPSSVDGYFQWLIDQYNDGMINAKFKLDVGVNQGAYLDKNNYIYRENDQFPSVASELEDKILDSLGGYLTLTYPNGSPTLNLYSDVHEANTQIIDFGVNLLDFSKETATSDQYTAIRPVGGTPERDSDDPEPVTLEPLGDGVTSVDSDYIKRGDVVYCLSAVNRYGYKEYNWSEGDTLDPQELLEKAVAELKKNVEPKLTIEVSAVDMALFAEGYDHLECGQVARVRSKPHGIDEYLMVSSVDIDLQDPSQTKYTLGQAFDSLTGEQSSYVKSLNSGINSSLDSVAALDQTVKDQASQIGSVEQIANDAKDTATNAQNTANSAQQAAQDAQNSASSALDKAEAAEGAVSEIQGMIEDINSGAEQAKQDAAQAKADAEEAAAKADAAAEKADSYQQQLTDVTTTVNGVVQEVEGYTAQISGAVQDAEAALTATTTLATDLNGFKTQVNQTYATKDALNQEVLNRQSAIEQTASSITQTVSENYTELKGYSDAAQSTAEEALSAANQANSDLADFTSTVTGDLADLQDQIDGNIATWFYAGTPTLTNEPAVNWSTTEEKNQHLGDLYYDTNNGYAWRFMVQNGSYSWGRITDSDVTKALEDAANAQDTADSKRRVFVSQPTPPYDVGDLWVQGENGDILRCATPRASGSYNASDWVLASKYTDDSALEIFEGQVADIYSTKAELETATDSITATVEENFEKSVLVKEADGGVVDCGDTAGMPLAGLTVYGQTRQNLWVNPTFENTKGLTASSNSNGSITISGTVTDVRYAVSSSRIYTLKPNTEYTLSIDKKVADSYSNTGTGACFYVNLKDEAGEYLTDIIVGYGSVLTKTFTTPSNLGRAACCFTAYNGTTISGTYRIMLNEGSEAEPWCHPGLSSVSEVVLLTANANLAFIDPSNITGSHAGVTTTVDEQGWVTWTGTPTSNVATGWGNTSIFGHIPAGTVLKAAVEGDPQYCYFGVNYVLSGSSTHYATTLYSGAVTPSKPWTVPEGVSYVYVFLAFKGGAQGETINERLRLSIYIGDEPVFEPGNYRSKEIPLLGNPLRSLPDGTRDELHIDAGGEVTLTKRVEPIKFDGDEKFGASSMADYIWYYDPSSTYDLSDDNVAYCDKRALAPRANYGANRYKGCLVGLNSGGGADIWFSDYPNTDKATFTNSLASSPVTFLLKRKEPQTLPLGKVDLPALNAAGANVWVVASDASGNVHTLDPDIHAIWYAENASALKNFASKAELKVESDQIKATVEETYSTKEEVSAVEDKADAAQDDLDAYKTTVSTTYATKSSVTQTANSIKQEVAAEYTTKEEFEGLEVGGRNLIANTKSMPIGWSRTTQYGAYAGTAPVDTGGGIKLSFDGSANRSLTVPLAFDGAVENGETVTLSFDYRGNITDFGSLYFMMRTTPNVGVTMPDPSSISETEWSHYKWTFSEDDANARTCYYILLFYALAKYDSTKWIEIKKGSLKLEKGTKATDWSPAPEDMLSTSDAQATYATKTSLQQTEDSILSSVESEYQSKDGMSSYATKSYVDQQDNSIKTTVSSVQTTANNALSKASTVEQTAEGLEVTLTSTTSTANAALSKANSAATAASNAQSTADAAKKQVWHTATGTSGTAGYIGIATIKITSAYANVPLYFEFTSRSRKATPAWVRFTSVNSVDPTLNYFTADGDANVYIRKTATSTWQVIVQKSEAYDQVSVTDFNNGGNYMNGKVSVTWTNTMLTSLPSECTKATVLAGKRNSSDIDNAAKTATNYLKFDSSGLCVGNMTGTLQGNTLITSDGVKIRNGTTVLASFTASEVQLGGASSSIQFGDYAHVTGSNSGASFGYGSIDGDQGSFLQLKDKEVTLQWPRVGTGGVKVTGLRFHTNTNQSFSGGKLYHQDRYLDGTSGTTYQYFCGRRLYYNASGTTGNVTLAESAANFYFIDIFFMNNDNYRDYVRVYAPNGNSAVLSNSVYKNEYTTTYVRNKVVTISGTSISVVSNRNGEAQVKQNNSCYATDSTSVIKIYAVWGWQ